MESFNLFARVARLLSFLIHRVRADAQSDRIVLVPLRLFIGLGWLRAFAEKATDAGWRDGSSLSVFLSDHSQNGDVAFPLYGNLISYLFLPNVTALGWIVMLGQLFVGLAILCGALTNAAFLGGLFMNLNFLLAGVPDPSAFYIVIQAALFQANAGAIVGVDYYLGERVRPSWLAAQLSPLPAGPGSGRRRPLMVAAFSGVVAIYALTHVTAWDPAGSVHDPAMILAILAMMTAAWSAFALLRNDAPPNQPVGTHDREVAPAGIQGRAHWPSQQDWAPVAVSETALSTDRAA